MIQYIFWKEVMINNFILRDLLDITHF